LENVTAILGVTTAGVAGLLSRTQFDFDWVERVVRAATKR
jgi:hypothetical protein